LARELVILKLGGSVITDKSKPFAASVETIGRLSEEIAHANFKPMAIVHGGGSFGHSVAAEHRISKGYEGSGQLMGFAKTRQAMMQLNKLVTDSLISHGIAAVSLQPSAFIITANGRIVDLNTNIIEKLLGKDLVPVLYGDAVMDEKMGFTILSGDQIAARLAIALNASRIVLAVDVDGVYTADPKLDSSAKLIGEMRLRELRELVKELGENRKVADVTGQMLGKIEETVSALENGVSIAVVNGLKPGRLLQALKNRRFIGTIIRP